MGSPSWDPKDVRYLVDLIGVCKDGLVRARYGQLLAETTGIAVQTISREVEKAHKGQNKPLAPGPKPPVLPDAEIDERLYKGNTLLQTVMEIISTEHPVWPWEGRRLAVPPREMLQMWDGGKAWTAFIEAGWPVLLGAIAETRGVVRAWEARMQQLESDGAFPPEAALDAWVETVWPTFCIGPELYRLRYGMLPADLMMEEIAMEERKQRQDALADCLSALRSGGEPEDGGFLSWFLTDAREAELRQLLDGERKVQRGLWPEWEDEEALAAWAAGLSPDWAEEFSLEEAGHSALETAQQIARLQSFGRCRSILNAAKRLGHNKVLNDYGASGKLAEEKR